MASCKWRWTILARRGRDDYKFTGVTVGPAGATGKKIMEETLRDLSRSNPDIAKYQIVGFEAERVG